ncbi:MAG: META domain-containing protein [Gemmatimonadaceae bacterium]
MSSSRSIVVAAVLLALVACNKAGSDEANKSTPAVATVASVPTAAAAAPDSTDSKPPAMAQHIENRDWKLVSIGASATADGLASSGITLRLDSGKSQATGFGGCNRYNGKYTQHADSLKFGPLASTKMACAEPTAASVEMIYLGVLPNVIGYRVDQTGLALYGTEGIVARFVSKE